MIRNLTFAELTRLFHSVFALRQQERALTFLVDLPTDTLPDHHLWKDRRRIETEWFLQIQSGLDRLPFTAVNFCAYDNVGSNNNDLPGTLQLVEQTTVSGDMRADVSRPLRAVLEESSIVVAMTELSTTAPLKNLAKEIPFRGATMPGFTRAMIPALGLDYEKVHARVMELKERLDRATQADLAFTASGSEYELTIDLRFRTAHASGGIIRDEGIVANLPSGEAYIVPFEGDARQESRTSGLLPVQFGDELVVFQVKGNRAEAVLGDGVQASAQRDLLNREPAYGNIAELGLGVLGEWGIKPAGSTLLDEKLGLHVAFGRSDHFGGLIGPGAFADPANVVHVDWVYSPHLQPMVAPRSVRLHYQGSPVEEILVDGKIVI